MHFRRQLAPAGQTILSFFVQIIKMLLLSSRRKREKRRITIDVGFCHQIIGYKYVLYIYFHDYFVLNLLHRFVFVFAQTCRVFGGSEL